MSSKEKDRLLTPKKVKEFYGIEPTKVYNWIKHRRFRFIKPAKEILFWESDFLNFLSRHEVPESDTTIRGAGE